MSNIDTKDKQKIEGITWPWGNMNFIFEWW